MNITERVAYLKGLMNGLDIDAASKEGKLFSAILEVLDEMALSIVDVEEAYDELQEVVDAIDEDLGSWKTTSMMKTTIAIVIAVTTKKSMRSYAPAVAMQFM